MDIPNNWSTPATSLHPATLRDRVVPFFAGCILFFVAGTMTLLFGVMGFMPVLEHIRVKSWPRVPAVIEASEIQKGPSGNYKNIIRYHYNFQGREFQSHNWNFIRASELLHRNQAQALASEYPAGSRVVVYVNPNHPNFSILDASPILWWVTPLFVIGALLVAEAIFLMRRSVTAFCIVTTGGNRSGRRFYFYNSLEEAEQAMKWSSVSPEALHPGTRNERIKPILGGMFFIVIGITVLTLFILFRDQLGSSLVTMGSILMTLFIIMGTALTWKAATAPYILDRKSQIGGEEISFYNTKEDLLRAQQFEDSLMAGNNKPPQQP